MRCLLVFALLTVAHLSPAGARIWRVTPDGGGDAPTIQAAVDSADAGDTVLLAAGTYTWATQEATGQSMLYMKPGLTLMGEGGASTTILDAQEQGRVIACERTGEVRIEGLTIARGSRGGLFAATFALPTLVRCIFRENSFGAAIHCEDAFVRECEIVDNLGLYGAYGVGVTATGRLEISGSRIAGNQASGHVEIYGGAIWAYEAEMSDCVIENNRIESSRGAAGGGASVGRGTITRCIFSGNTVWLQAPGTLCAGGALDAGDVVVTDCVFVGNTAASTSEVGRGGAIASQFPVVPLTVERCTILGNHATGFGNQLDAVGGIAAPAANVSSCIIAWNDGRAVGPTVTTRCTSFFGNGLGDQFRGVEMGGNFIADPQFCAVDPRTTLFVGLQSDSPCAAGQHPDAAPCGRIGAGDVQCAAVRAEHRTWGDIKLLFGGSR